MSYRLVAVEIHDEVMYAPTGTVGRWATAVARELKSAAIAEAPTGRDTGRVNKSRQNAAEPVGSLKRGIRSSTSRTGPHSLDITLSSGASYSMYVLKGTPTAYSRSARVPKGEPGAGQFIPLSDGEGGMVGMYLPANPGYGKSKFVQRRKGQRANPFFDRAVRTVATRHASLRGFSMR
jgi:hypothetical protein